MGNKKKPQLYFASDFHMGHKGIIKFERGNFSSVQEHDKFLIDMVENWAHSWGKGSTLYYLGDFGDMSYLWMFDVLRQYGHEVVFLAGNHDKNSDANIIKAHVDEYHAHPVYLTDKLVISHEPVNVWESQVNVHGHLHSAVLNSENHINASIHVAKYQPVSEKNLQTAFSNLPKHCTRFLYEPWAEQYKFTQEKEDIIYDKNGRIDLSASRVMQRLATERRIKEGNRYRPYCGGLA